MTRLVARTYRRLFGRLRIRRMRLEVDTTTHLLSSEPNRERLALAMRQAEGTEPPQTVIDFPEAVER